MKPTNRRTFTNWQDIGFAPLPAGWVNVFKAGGNYWTEPCPGVITQRADTYDEFWDEEHDDGRVESRQQSRPRDEEMRIAFVCAGYIGEPYARAVDDEPGYIVTTTSEQWEAWHVDEISGVR